MGCIGKIKEKKFKKATEVQVVVFELRIKHEIKYGNCEKIKRFFKYREEERFDITEKNVVEEKIYERRIYA